MSLLRFICFSQFFYIMYEFRVLHYINYSKLEEICKLKTNICSDVITHTKPVCCDT